MKPHIVLMVVLPLWAAAACLPLAGFVYFGWTTCAGAVVAEPTMVPVPALLLSLNQGPESIRWTSAAPRDARYTYRFGGRVYTGSAITFCPALSRGSQIDPTVAMAARLIPLVGKGVTAWVDPQQPQHAVLVRYVPRAAMWVLGAGLLILLVATIKAYRYVALAVRRRLGATSSLSPHSSESTS